MPSGNVMFNDILSNKKGMTVYDMGFSIYLNLTVFHRLSLAAIRLLKIGGFQESFEFPPPSRNRLI